MPEDEREERTATDHGLVPDRKRNKIECLLCKHEVFIDAFISESLIAVSKAAKNVRGLENLDNRGEDRMMKKPIRL